MLAFLLTSAFGQKVFYLPHIGDGMAQISPELLAQFQTTVVFVSTGEGGDVTVEFFTSSGDPLSLTLMTAEGDTLGPDSTLNITLGPGEAFSAETVGVDPLQVGYARVTSTDMSVGGTAVFTQSDVNTQEIIYEAGVPATDNAAVKLHPVYGLSGKQGHGPGHRESSGWHGCQCHDGPFQQIVYHRNCHD